MTERHENLETPRAANPMQAVFSAWIGTEDCMAHSSDWQYWTYGKRHCLGCLRDGWLKNSGELLSVAADMARGARFPSPYREDWPKRITWPVIEDSALRADAAAKDWAVRIRSAFDRIHGR